MYNIDAEAVPVGWAKYTAADLASNIAITTAPTNGVALPTNADSANIFVSGTKCYASFDGTAATANSIELAVGPYTFVNCRTALKNLNLLRSDASTVVSILYTSINGR